jgi:hypothetical protein
MTRSAVVQGSRVIGIFLASIIALFSVSLPIHAQVAGGTILGTIPALRGPLLGSERLEDIIKAFENHAQPHAQDFVARASDIFALIKDPKFPQRAKAQINYIAESVAGRPTVSLRTSLDICGKKRDEEVPKSPYKIIRKEFYIVCECGYKRAAKYDACQKCGAHIFHSPGTFARSGS